MPARRPTGLAGRLAPYLPQRFDAATYAWWPPTARWRRSGVPHRRTAQLAQVVDRLAVLVGVGDGLDRAIVRIARTGRGPVADELDAVAASLGDGVPVPSALRSWARQAACPHVAQLAADLRTCTSVDDAAGVLERHARVLRQRADRNELWRLCVRVTVIWVTAAAAAAATALAIAG